MPELRQVSQQEFDKLKSQYGLDDAQARAVLKVEPIKSKWAEANTQNADTENSSAKQTVPSDNAEMTPEFESEPSENVDGQFSNSADMDFATPDEVFPEPSVDTVPDFSAPTSTPEFNPEFTTEFTPDFSAGVEDVDVADFSTMSFDAPETVPDFEFNAPEFDTNDFVADNQPQSFDAVKQAEEDIATEFVADEKNMSDADFAKPTFDNSPDTNTDTDNVPTSEIESVADDVALSNEPVAKNTPENDKAHSVDTKNIDDMMRAGTRKILDRMHQNSALKSARNNNTK